MKRRWILAALLAAAGAYAAFSLVVGPSVEVATVLQRDVVQSVVAIFEEAAVQTRAELAAAAGDRSKLAMLGHRQRGTAACVGARRLAASLSQLEAIALSATAR